MEIRKTQLALTASAFAMALVLVGCGGGSSSTTSVAPPAAPAQQEPDTTTPEPAEPTVNTVSLPTEMPMDYMAPTGMMMVAAGETWTPEGSDVTFSCPADGEACDIEVMADGSVTSTGGEATAALTAGAMTRLEAEKTMMAAETEGRSMGLQDALTDKSGTRGQQIIGETDSKGANLDITRGMSGGAMVNNGRLGGMAGWENNMADQAISDDFEGHKLIRKMTSATETIVVYTDIDAAEHKAFLAHYAGATPIADINGVSITVDNTPANATYGRVTLTAAAMAAAGNAELLDKTKFPQPADPGKGNKTYTYNNGEGANEKKSSFKGTFHGAPGTYNCATADCVVQVTASSTNSAPGYVAVALPGGDWTFTPDADNNPQIVLQDADHMHFGWWVKTPTKAAADGQYLYDAEMFYGGNMPFSDTNIVALQGDATYTGPAGGLFAVKAHKDKDDMDVAAANGEFMATATLTAKFGDATAQRGSISGKIESFVRDDGVSNDWALTLGKADMHASAAMGDGPVAGASNDIIGAWKFQMYGSGKNGANPTGIAGSFRAAIDANTAVAGAFATK